MNEKELAQKAELLELIEGIVVYGVENQLNPAKSRVRLQKSLLQLYAFYVSADLGLDDEEGKEFDRSAYAYVPENVKQNFPDFGYFKTFRDLHNLGDVQDVVVADAVEILTAIVYDMLETKWRIENNGVYNGFDFFDTCFRTRTQQQVIDLLNYMQVEG